MEGQSELKPHGKIKKSWVPYGCSFKNQVVVQRIDIEHGEKIVSEKGANQRLEWYERKRLGEKEDLKKDTIEGWKLLNKTKPNLISGSINTQPETDLPDRIPTKDEIREKITIGIDDNQRRLTIGRFNKRKEEREFARRVEEPEKTGFQIRKIQKRQYPLPFLEEIKSTTTSLLYEKPFDPNLYPEEIDMEMDTIKSLIIAEQLLAKSESEEDIKIYQAIVDELKAQSKEEELGEKEDCVATKQISNRTRANQTVLNPAVAFSQEIAQPMTPNEADIAEATHIIRNVDQLVNGVVGSFEKNEEFNGKIYTSQVGEIFKSVLESQSDEDLEVKVPGGFGAYIDNEWHKGLALRGTVNIKGRRGGLELTLDTTFAVAEDGDTFIEKKNWNKESIEFLQLFFDHPFLQLNEFLGARLKEKGIELKKSEIEVEDSNLILHLEGEKTTIS